MEKKYQKIYIWSFIIISGIILLLMYTPLGGDIHKSTYGSLEYRGYTRVDFGSRINNAPKVSKNRKSNQYTSPKTDKNSSYSFFSRPVVSSNHSRPQMSGSGSYQNNFYSKKAATPSNGGGGGSMIALNSRGGSASSDAGSSSALGGGLFNSSMPGSTSTMQKAVEEDFTPADPGGEVLGDPLPVGDGVYLMLFFALIYGLYKLTSKRWSTRHPARRE